MILPDPAIDAVQIITSPDSSQLRAAAEGASVAVLLAEVNALAIRLRQRGRTASGSAGDLPGAEHDVLEILDRNGPRTVPQIASQRCTSRQNIQILVDRLAEQGRVELAPNPAHKRSALVRLTAEGKRSLDAGEQGQKELLTQIETHLSDPEVDAVVAVLRKVHGLLANGRPKPAITKSAPDIPRSPRPGRMDIPAPADAESEEFPVNLL